MNSESDGSRGRECVRVQTVFKNFRDEWTSDIGQSDTTLEF